ncbi:unnamed protein product [Dracunculus medinensis]|uniref:phosphoethanolamine N-methyltransferase n=1 Tax=Dracunculus medinensis TaxID=318479 RepID=A0A0N4U4I0_DRAME|nr:unnamed protein product [Dracunculus medinensis]
MPAGEREVVQMVLRNIQGDPNNILLIDPTNTFTHDAFYDSLGNDTAITKRKGCDDLNDIDDDTFNVVVLNQVINTSKILDDPPRVDLLMKSILRVVLPQGTIVIRENLSNCPKINAMVQLTNFLDTYKTNLSNSSWSIKFVSMNQISDSIHAKNSKILLSNENITTFRDFLDTNQFTESGILVYEWVFGKDFISPGGAEENLKIMKRAFTLLEPGKKLLDIGCGIGGGVRQAASEFGLEVVGIDLSSNMLSIAIDRLQKCPDSRIRYCITDALKANFIPESFDYVLSRDALQHNDDIGKLFSNIHVLVSTGFQDVRVEAKNQRFREILNDELSRTIKGKSEFLKKFGDKEYEKIVNGWKDKLSYIDDDNMCWIELYAKKPNRI